MSGANDFNQPVVLEFPANAAVASGESVCNSGRVAQQVRLRPPRAELEAPGRGVREGMIEDLERRLMLVEDELEVVVARSIGDGDCHQVRRSTPKQAHRDAV